MSHGTPAAPRADRAASELAIEATGISKTYRGGIQALVDVSLCIGWGEIFAYLGRNGSGKTTTVRVLTTLSPLTAGRATVAGHDVSAEPYAVRRAVGVALQEAALDDLMTGREHLRLVGRLSGRSPTEARRRAEELLETFGLERASRRLIATYSGGMRRRLDVATALFNRPRVLFLDEPTTGLDPQSRRGVWSMIRNCREEGGTVFLTTQYIEEAEQLADVVTIIDEGAIIASGATGELRSHLGVTTVKVRFVDTHERDLAAIVGDPAASVDPDGWARIELSGDGACAQAADLVGRLARQTSIAGLSVSEPSLEDVFVRLTGDRIDRIPGQEGAGAGTAARRAVGLAGGGRAS